MKKLGIILLCLFFLSACSKNESSQSMVVYYSNNDPIESLAVQIAEDTDSEVFRIVRKRLFKLERKNRKGRIADRFRNRRSAIDKPSFRTKRAGSLERIRYDLHRFSDQFDQYTTRSRICFFEPERPQA